MKKSEWIPVGERLPEPEEFVLLNVVDDGRSSVIRAFHAPKHTVETYSDNDFFECNEDDADDEALYLPEGWYEANTYEDTHWYVNGVATHWMPLPKPLDVVAKEGRNG